MPLLAARQRDRGGAVVAVQVENELDFFDTADRPAYMSRLHDLALGHGITVPVVACAGQGDLAGATGGVDGITPAFNFYPDDRSPFVEAEVRQYADLVTGRGEPLLVMETNRRHATLRRLLVSGAKVIAPYLQASGFDFGYTPSVGNWGDPGGFMSHDYDFGGYLDPVGAPRPEMAEARVLARVLRTLGPALARSTTASADGALPGRRRHQRLAVQAAARRRWRADRHPEPDRRRRYHGVPGVVRRTRGGGAVCPPSHACWSCATCRWSGSGCPGPCAWRAPTSSAPGRTGSSWRRPTRA